jgi:SAM-dependent methyltransferase
VQNADRRDFYTDYYALHAGNERAQRWRGVTAATNADYVEALLTGAGIRPGRVIDIGCGDGALVVELAKRRLGSSFVGYEISESVVDFIRSRDVPELEHIELFDGEHVLEPADSFDLALLVNVVEHAPQAVRLLREARRLAPHVVVAIALEETASARRSAYQRTAAKIGHVRRFSLESARALLEEAELTVLAETVTPPTITNRTFWRDGRLERTRAYAGGLARLGLYRVSPALSRRLFAVDYTCLCTASARRAPTGRFRRRAAARA